MFILAQNLIHKIHQQTNTPTITEIMILMGTNITEKAMVNALLYFNTQFSFWILFLLHPQNSYLINSKNGHFAPILFEHAAALYHCICSASVN